MLNYISVIKPKPVDQLFRRHKQEMSSFKLSVGDFLDKLDSVASSQVKISILEDVLKKLDQERKEDEKMNQDPSAERESAIALLSSVRHNILQTISSSSNLQPPPRDLFTAPSSSSLQPPTTDFFREPSSSAQPPPTHFFTTSLRPPSFSSSSTPSTFP